MQKVISAAASGSERDREAYEAFLKESRKKMADEGQGHSRQEDNLAEVREFVGMKLYSKHVGLRV